MSKVGLAIVFSTSALVSFNAMLWQISRRSEKQKTIANHSNLKKRPLHELPSPGAATDEWEFHPIELKGTFDNEGSVLVGPRHVQTHRGTQVDSEKRGGFTVVTPFEIANSNGKFVMVNRGWVPIDAAKHRVMLTQYIGEGFQHADIRGVLRKEEFSKDYLGRLGPENFGPVATGMAWFVLRPYEIALEYYGKRWGSENLQDMKLKHGTHHYALEMIEDFSGTDQRLVKGIAYPRRRELDEITHIHLSPTIHALYVAFWGFTCVLSLYCLRHGFIHQRAVIRRSKQIQERTGEFEKKLQLESKEYYEKLQLEQERTRLIK